VISACLSPETKSFNEVPNALPTLTHGYAIEMHGGCDVFGHCERREEFARLKRKTDMTSPNAFDEAVSASTPSLFEIDEAAVTAHSRS